MRVGLHRIAVGLSRAWGECIRSAQSVTGPLVWLFLAATLSKSLGTFDEEILRLAACGVVTVLVLVTVARRGSGANPRAILTGSGALLLWVSATLATNHHLVWLALLPCAVLGCTWLALGMHVPQRDPSGLVRALVLFSLLYLAWLTVPPIWHATVATSRFVSNWSIQKVLNENVTLGPSMSGCWMLLLAISYLTVEAWTTRRWIRPALGVLAAFTAWFGFMLLLTQSWFAAQDGPGIARAQILGFFIIALPPVVLCGRRGVSLMPAGTFKWKSRHAVSVAIIVVSSIVLTHSPDFGKEPGRRMLVYGRGYLDWKVPQFGEYGPFSGGMFGLMPKYLALEGYQVSIIRDEIITSQALEGHDILVLINLGKEQGKEWKNEEIETIWAYVEQGGAILILGDHTNVFGLQDCFNELLARVRIRFEFDSAYPCREGWQNCIASRPHPLTGNLPTYRGFGIAIGASLTISSPAFPVVFGRFSFSDKGYKENVMGSYLGNYAYEKGEPIGDMVLVAAAYYGKGKVLVFGDTSMFQNGAWFAGFQPFAHNIVRWLSTRSVVRGYGSLQLALWVVLTGSLFVLSIRMKRDVALFLAPYCLGLGILVGWMWLGLATKSPVLEGDLALFDYSHGPRVNIDGAETTGVGGFLTNLDRNGYLSLRLDEFDHDQIMKSKLYATVAPVVPYSSSEIKTLIGFMERGGFVIAASGYPERSGILPLLARLGLDVANVPLGSIPQGRGGGSNDTDPRFVDAYPIVVRASLAPDEQASIVRQTEPLYKYGDYVTAVYRKYGRGGLIFFADTRFLSSANIEGMPFGYHLGNILFLKSIFEHVRTGE